MAFQKLSLEVNAAGTLNAPIVITTNLEVGSWQLKDPRVFADECSVGTNAVSQASFLYQALLQDCVFGDKFGECLVEYDNNQTVSITFYDLTVTSAVYSEPIVNGMNIVDVETTVSSDWRKLSQDILVRSPYFIGIGDDTSPLGNINGCNLDMYIYTGTFLEDRPSTPTFSLDTLSTNINETIYFDLSDMIKDYLSEYSYTNTGGVACECVFVDLFPTVNYNGLDYPQAPEYHRAFLGYGYFEDGVNPLLIDYSPDASPNDYKEILNESPKIILPTNEIFEIAVDSNLIDTVEYFSPADVSLKLDTISGSNASSEQIIYSTSPILPPHSRDDGVGYVIVTNLDASTSQIEVCYEDECKYTPIRVTFINRNGVYERLWFFKNNKKESNIKREEFRRNTFSSGTYNTVDHQKKTLFKKSSEKLTINSGFYSEDFNDVFNQLLLSEDVWIQYESRELPVNIKNSTFSYKTSLNDKLINQTIDLEFAFDKINSVK